MPLIRETVFKKKKKSINGNLDLISDGSDSLGWKLAIRMSWVICEFKADLMVTHNLNYIHIWVKAADGRVEPISILSLMIFRVNKRIWWLLSETWNNERATMTRQRWVLSFAEYALLNSKWRSRKEQNKCCTLNDVTAED